MFVDSKGARHLDPREAITYFLPMDEREVDRAPLSLRLIRRIWTYTRPYARKRNALLLLTFLRGVQMPTLAWMIGATIKGPVADRNQQGIFLYTGAFLGLILVTVGVFHFRQRYALELGEAVVHDMRSDLFRKLMGMPMSFFTRTKFGRIISRMTSDIDSVKVGVQEVAFVSIVQALQMAVSAG
jgi:ATP-binding cassette subfamily B protein